MKRTILLTGGAMLALTSAAIANNAPGYFYLAPKTVDQPAQDPVLGIEFEAQDGSKVPITFNPPLHPGDEQKVNIPDWDNHARCDRIARITYQIGNAPVVNNQLVAVESSMNGYPWLPRIGDWTIASHFSFCHAPYGGGQDHFVITPLAVAGAPTREVIGKGVGFYPRAPSVSTPFTADNWTYNYSLFINFNWKPYNN